MTLKWYKKGEKKKFSSFWKVLELSGIVNINFLRQIYLQASSEILGVL